MLNKLRLNIKYLMILITALMVIQGYLFYKFIEDMESTKQWSRHTLAVIISLQSLQINLQQQNLNFIKSFTTGNFQPINNSIVMSGLNELKGLTKDNPEQTQNINDLESLLYSQSQQNDEIMNNKSDKMGIFANNELYTNKKLQETVSKINSIINKMISIEQNLLSDRNKLNEKARSRFYRFNFLAAVASYFVLFAFVIMLMKSLKDQRLLHVERIKANERFQKLFEVSADAHLIFDQDGIIDCNQAVLKILKCYDKSQIIGRHPSEFSPQTQSNKTTPQEKRAQIEKELSQKGYVKFDWILKRFDGVEIQIEVSLTSILLDNKEVSLAIWHDVSEQRKYQHMLEQIHKINANKSVSLSEKIKQIITMGSQYYHLHSGMMGKVENNTFYVMYTSQSENTLRQGNSFPITEKISKYFNLSFLLAQDRISTKNSIFFGEYPVGCFIGCPIYVNGQPYGTISYFKGKPKLEPFSETEKTFIHIISQWIGSEIEGNLILKELETNVDRLERAIKSAHDGLWEWNCITNKVFVNSRYKEILGYEEDDASLNDDLETFSQLIHPDDSSDVWSAVDETFKNNVPFNIQFRLRRKDGSYAVVHSRGDVYRNPNGKPILLSGVLTDISNHQKSIFNNV